MKVITRDADGNSEITFDVTFKQYYIPMFAALMDEAFEVEKDGYSEFGQAGDWLVCNPTGEYFPVHSKVFEDLYVLKEKKHGFKFI